MKGELNMIFGQLEEGQLFFDKRTREFYIKCSEKETIDGAWRIEGNIVDKNTPYGMNRNDKVIPLDLDKFYLLSKQDL